VTGPDRFHSSLPTWLSANWQPKMVAKRAIQKEIHLTNLIAKPLLWLLWASILPLTPCGIIEHLSPKVSITFGWNIFCWNYNPISLLVGCSTMGKCYQGNTILYTGEIPTSMVLGALLPGRPTQRVRVQICRGFVYDFPRRVSCLRVRTCAASL
jgi:hypothetical protein